MDIESLVKAISAESDQDASCPHAKWLGEDLTHLPGVGEVKCIKQSYATGDFGMSTDYKRCSSPKHAECPVYLSK